MIAKTLDQLPDGRAVSCWTLRNETGASVAVMELGATLLSVLVPDRNGAFCDVTLGHGRLADYWNGRYYFGSVIGRYANRLANAAFELDGLRFELPSNDGPNTLHGGPDGFDRRLWTGNVVKTPDGDGVRLSLRSEHGDQGFPGTLELSVTYVWTADNRLITDFAATCDRPTPLNLTLHSYWNLSSSDRAKGIADHELELAAGSFLPVDRFNIPTGEICPVAGTPFDFSTPGELGDRLQALRQQPGSEMGFDHCWVIDGSGLRRAAVLFHPESGCELTIETDRPGIQVYTANHLGPDVPGRKGQPCARHCAVALETQDFPDAPNQPGFPGTVLRPGQAWRSRTVYSFRVRQE